MSAMATIEPDEQLVAQPRAVTTFISKRQNLRLVKRPRRTVRNASGEEVDQTAGQSIQFDVYLDPIQKQRALDAGLTDKEAVTASRYGRYDCPTEGMVELERGEEIPAEELHAWLMRHRLNGDWQEGFWRLEVAAPAPTREELDRLMQAAYDEDMLVKLIEQERAGWDREDIVSVAVGALERLRALKVEAQAAVDAEAALEAEKPVRKPAAKG
jgi:hypothetical protein